MKTNIILAAIAAAALAIIPAAANAQGHEPDKNGGPRTELRDDARKPEQHTDHKTPAKPDVKPDRPGKPAPADVHPANPTPAPRHAEPAPEPDNKGGIRVSIPGINININL